MVRYLLEYVAQLWISNYEDTKLQNRVKRHAKKMNFSIGFGHDERLKRLNFLAKKRQLRKYFTAVLKCLFKFSNIAYQRFFKALNKVAICK